jgi:hypothetical protein
MLTFLLFLRDYEMVWFYVLGLAALWYLYRFLAAQVRLIRTNFGLERELFAGRRNGAAGRLILVGLAGAGIFLAVNYGLPEAERAERLRRDTGAVDLPTITPTSTPFELFGVDVSGCANPKATILQPKPGDAVTGKTDILIVADIPDFAFFLLELGRPDEPDNWVTLFSENLVENQPATVEGSSSTPAAVPGLFLPATAEEPFSWTWNSSTVTPGVYHLRLTVMAVNQKYPPPCVVPIQVLAQPPG